MRLTVDVNYITDGFKENKHPRKKNGKFASEPGGTTEYSHASTTHNTSHPAFHKTKALAHSHADYLQGLGHKGVDVGSREELQEVPGRGYAKKKTWVVYHGNPGA